MQNEETIEKLNALIQINNDRVEGYETAAKETNEADLKILFEGFQQTSRQCRSELSAEVMKFGGEPTDSTKASGKFFRVWMDVKAALSRKDRHVILDSCEFGEDQALKSYREVLEEESALNASQRMIVQSQYDALKADHNRVKALRDAAKD
ncbi:MAG: PA2169 family four-helix-bundle protein [Chitinophagaceae bacterium]|nr:PA2169 family four-helix-bundle protein [Chitinophagaceae bacterium]